MARPDLDALLNSALPFAQQMLAKQGGFQPFGVSMNAAGQLKQNAAHTGVEHPSSQELIDMLSGGFRSQAAKGELKAIGVCLDSRTIPPGGTEKVDAICVRMEHADGEAVDVFSPYRKGWFGKITFSDLFAAPGQRSVFA